MEKKLALLSVYNKKDIDILALKLINNNFNIITSGGTYTYLINNITATIAVLILSLLLHRV